AFGEAVRKALNDCSPALFMSQVKLLANVDPRRWKSLRKHLSDSATFIYMIGELPDDTLDARQAAKKYFGFFGVVVGSNLLLIEVADAGHADTFRSALTLEE